MNLPSLEALSRRMQPLEIGLVALFGSQARGSAHLHSDVDVGVLGLDGRPLNRRAFAEAYASLSDWFEAAIDLADLATPDAIFRYEVAGSGVVLYERTPGLWIAFVAKTLIDYADVAPFIPACIEGVARAARAYEPT